MKKYDTYKPSGIDWIGEIPEHWELKKQKFIAKLYTGDSLNDKEKEEYSSVSDSTAIPYIASKDIDRDIEFIDYENGMMIPLSNEKEFVKAPKNSFLLCIEGGSAGKKMGYLDRPVCFVNKLCCFDSKLNKFHYYYIKSKSFSDSFVRCLQGMIGGVSVTELSNLKIPIPPFSEQTAIANYLDAKCAKIDNVVSVQQKRIELLKELKQSIITKAVTKGLIKNAKMKDSGVDWIGEVPEWWDVKKLKYIGTICSGDGLSSQEIMEEGDYEVYGGNGICGYTEKYNVIDNHIIIGRVGALCGNIHISKGKRFITDNALIYTIKNDVNIEYLTYLMVTADFNKLNTSSAQPLITGTKVINVKICLPSQSEQIAIATYLDKKCATIDKQIQKVEKQIELLKEYKQSVITECVTGKRKVC